MSLDMPDEGTRALKMTTARSVRFFVNLGLGLVFYGLLVKCSAMSLFPALRDERLQPRRLGPFLKTRTWASLNPPLPRPHACGCTPRPDVPASDVTRAADANGRSRARGATRWRDAAAAERRRRRRRVADAP